MGIGPNVKLSHPERGYEFGVAYCCRTGVRATLAAKRVRVGCSAWLACISFMELPQSSQMVLGRCVIAMIRYDARQIEVQCSFYTGWDQLRLVVEYVRRKMRDSPVACKQVRAEEEP